MGIVAQDGAQAGGGEEPVRIYDSTSQCTDFLQRSTKPCGYTLENSVSSDELVNKTISGSDILNGSISSLLLANNTIQTQDIKNGEVSGDDVGTLKLSNFEGVIPQVFATKSFELTSPPNANAYIGDPPGAPSNPAFLQLR